MRLTGALNQQHLGFMFKKHWLVQGRRVIRDDGVAAELRQKGIEVEDAVELFNKKKPVQGERLKIPTMSYRKMDRDDTHPLWKTKCCYVFSDTNVLVEGMDQTQQLTNSICISSAPKQIEELLESIKISPQQDAKFRNSVMEAHLFDAEQVKLPKIKDPNRPAFNFPRIYGISDGRKNRLLISKLIFECEKMAGLSTSIDRRILHNARFVYPFERYGQQVKLEVTAETFMSSKHPIRDLKYKPKFKVNLPDVFPLLPTASMPVKNIYDLYDEYPILNSLAASHPHTILLHFSPTDVSNEFDLPVNDSQYRSRSLLKAFTVAASRARSLYGPDVKQLPEPIVVQCVQINVNKFHFGVFQLNTLDVNNEDDVRNQWFDVASIDLYTECKYLTGRPHMSDYNKDVLRYMYAFYKNN